MKVFDSLFGTKAKPIMKTANAPATAANAPKGEDHPSAKIKKLHVGHFGEDYYLIDGLPGIYRRTYGVGGGGILAWYRGELIKFERHTRAESSILEFADMLRGGSA